jgi:hypothetical protein
MEKFPKSESRSELLSDIEKLSTELQQCFLDIEHAKKDLIQAHKDLEENNKNYQELLTLILEGPDLARREKEERELNQRQEAFVSSMKAGIVEQESGIARMEAIYQQELTMFEELKTLLRESEHGISGTAH